MFLGYQGDLLAFVANTREELENLPMVELTKIDFTTEPVEMVENTYYIGEEAIKTAKQTVVRNYKNNLLKTEVDPVVTNPLRWTDMSEEEQEIYKNYRIYLRDYTDTEGWENQNPMTLEEWKAAESSK